MRTLFEEINALNVENDFALSFEILGVSKLWKIIRELPCEAKLRNQMVKFCIHAYSIDSKLFRAKKDRWQVKENIVQFLEIDVNDLVLDCMRCKQPIFNKFITAYLRESQSRDFALLASLEDSMYELLELARDGINFDVTCESPILVAQAMGIFRKNEILIKAEARKRAVEMKREIDSLEKQLNKDYDYLHGIVKKDSVEISDNLGWAERQVLKHRNNK